MSAPELPESSGCSAICASPVVSSAAPSSPENPEKSRTIACGVPSEGTETKSAETTMESSRAIARARSSAEAVGSTVAAAAAAAIAATTTSTASVPSRMRRLVRFEFPAKPPMRATLTHRRRMFKPSTCKSPCVHQSDTQVSPGRW